jgi:pyruvate dehydrogenase E2 component (dihydrolipoamide acetyltransferase)
VPHFYVATDCAIDRLLGLRKELNGPSIAGGGESHRLSINDFVIKALALALRKVPDANVSFAEDAMLRHRQVDIGVAVAIPGGLLTPVIRRADIKTITAISAEVKELANRAKDRKLKPEEYSGGTSSVSNLGMYGVQEFAAIINPPQSTILAVGAAERRVIANEDDSTSVASIVRVTLSADHRAVDGATAAQLLGAFKGLIENPMAMLI